MRAGLYQHVNTRVMVGIQGMQVKLPVRLVEQVTSTGRH